MFRLLILGIINFFVVSTVLAQHPNQWLISGRHIMDFSTSPPSIIAVPDTVIRNVSFLDFELLSSNNQGRLNFLSTGYNRIRKDVDFYKSGFLPCPYNSSFPLTPLGNAYNILNLGGQSQVSFSNGYSFNPVQFDHYLQSKRKYGILISSINSVDTIQLDSVATIAPGVTSNYKLIYQTDSTFTFMCVDTGETNDSHALRLISIDAQGRIIRRVKSKSGDFSGYRIFAANRDGLFVICERVKNSIRAALQLKFYRIENDLTVVSVKSHMIYSKNDKFIDIHAGAFSSNDSIFYFSYRETKSMFLTKGTTLARLNPYDANSPSDIELKDSLFIESIGLAPNSKLYFVHYKKNDDPITGFGVLDYPENPNPENVGVRLNTVITNRVNSGYLFGFLAKTNINVPQLHFKAVMGNCQDNFISCRNYSDKEFIKFKWELFDLDTNLIDFSNGSHATLQPKESGKHLVRLQGEDTDGKKSWRWQEIEYKAPIEIEIAEHDLQVCEYVNFKYHLTHNAVSSSQPEFRWHFEMNDTLILVKVGDTIGLNYFKSGVYDLKILIDYDGCLDTVVDPGFVEVFDAPKPGLILSEDSTCTGKLIKVIDASIGKVLSTEYTWTDGESFTNRKGHSRTIDSTGTFYVVQTLQGPSGCTSKDSMRIEILRGFDNQTIPLIKLATVEHNQRIRINWDTMDGAKGYHLYRNWNKITESFNGSLRQSFTDVFPDSVQQSYGYTMTATDFCDDSSKQSITAKTIYLTVKNENNVFTNLNWNAYSGWLDGVSEYEIQTSFDSINWNTIEGLKGLNYTDSRLSQLDFESMYYRIKATQQGGQSFESYSNVVAVNTQTNLFIPNAFTPNDDGINDIFKVGSFGLKEFQCQVFARNGQIVAYSNDPSAIWDGTSEISDQQFPVGAYTYIILATDNKGNSIEQIGQITLIR